LEKVDEGAEQMSTVFLVYGDCGDYYQPEEFLGAGFTREEAEQVAAEAKTRKRTWPAGDFPVWSDIEIREIETGKVLP